jgi:hypothetical protein
MHRYLQIEPHVRGWLLAWLFTPRLAEVSDWPIADLRRNESFVS